MNFFFIVFVYQIYFVYLHIQLNELLIRGCARHGQVQGAMRRIEIKVYTREEVEAIICKAEESIANTKPGSLFNNWCIDTDRERISIYKAMLEATKDDEIYAFCGEAVNDKLPEWMKI